jgi:carbonic anhydrase
LKDKKPFSMTLLPSPVEDYFYYMGSREAPTLVSDEGFIIGVVNQIQEISTEQIEQIRTGPQARAFAVAARHGVYRETQPLNGRLFTIEFQMP